ncbi:MAG: ABC transporter permease subunit [Planctomycetaceae bacterium]|nr:ABC transporter permease subunit [Planctomycetaceae bacterium]
MPIHNLGYREWHGELQATSSRWQVVAGIGIRSAWQSAWLRRMMFFAWVPGLVMGFMIFIYEQSAKQGSDTQDMMSAVAMALVTHESPDILFRRIQQERLVTGSRPSMGAERHLFWSALLQILFRRSQPFLLIPIVAVIAPPMISQDFRSRAFLLYFSRPLTKVQYIIGKAATVGLYLLCVTMFPALLLYFVGVLLSPDISVLYATWDLPLRVILTSLLIVIPCTMLALMLSSLTVESRYASFAWFAIWIFGHLTYVVIRGVASPGDSSIVQSVSLFETFNDLSSWILDPRLGVAQMETRFMLLGVLTAVCTAVLYRRVSAPMQV